MPTLADPLTLNGHLLRNRLVLPAMTTNYATPGGDVTGEVLGFYEQRARDVGLVIVEATAVRADGRLVPNSLGIWEESHVRGLARLAGAVKARGAVAVLQLNHAGARAVPLGGGDLQGASPSGLRLRRDLGAFELEPGQLRRIRDDFAVGAGRALQAGFDGVEVHGAHLYLLSQFLSPLTNRRRDRYGGTAAARATFPAEVLAAVRDRIGPKALLLFRMNGEERIEQGQTPRDAAEVAAVLRGAGIDALDVSLSARVAWREEGGSRFLEAASTLPKEDPPGAALPLAAAVRRAAGGPVIAVGKLAQGGTATAALGAGAADLVAIGRQMIVDPDAAGKILGGRAAELVACQECTSCLRSIGRGLPMTCSVNATPAGKPSWS